MSRIEKMFIQLKKKHGKALIVFLTAGDPSLANNEALIPALEKEGVDLVEIGVPFSDPLADGSVIQASSQRSLERGTTLEKILGLVKRVRRRCTIPLALMSYYNPVLRYGLARFAKDAARAGVDGVIIPDLPPDEGGQASGIFAKSGLDLVYLVAPTSTSARQKMISDASRGFIYFVSVTGVTGAGHGISKNVLKQVSSLGGRTKRALCVGFGVSKPGQVRQIARFASGVIVGSFVVKALAEHSAWSSARFTKKFIRPLCSALGKGK
jgi:tryptophan synthase alpha chain